MPVFWAGTREGFEEGVGVSGAFEGFGMVVLLSSYPAAKLGLWLT